MKFSMSCGYYYRGHATGKCQLRPHKNTATLPLMCLPKLSGRLVLVVMLTILPTVKGVCPDSKVSTQSLDLEIFVSSLFSQIESTIHGIIKDIVSSGSLTGPPGERLSYSINVYDQVNLL